MEFIFAKFQGTNYSQLEVWYNWQQGLIPSSITWAEFGSIFLVLTPFYWFLRKSLSSEVKAYGWKTFVFSPELSGLRGIAAFGVVLYHIIPSNVFPLLTAGWMGVELFLMLSMYLLLQSLDDKPDLKQYFLRRIKRIWPIYYGTVIAAFLIYHFSVGMLLQYFTFTQYWIFPTPGVPVLNTLWTLQLEEVVYFLIPVIHWSKHKLEIAFGFIGVNAIGAVVVCDLVYFSNPTQIPAYLFPIYKYVTSSSNYYFVAPIWLGAYGFGILAYLYRGRIPISARWLVPAVLIGLTASYYLGVNSGYLVLRQIAYFAALPGLAAVLVRPPRFLRYFTILGEGSYAIYAIQFFFLLNFGEVGIPLTAASGILIEFVLRPRTVYRRLKQAYGRQKTEDRSLELASSVRT